MEIDIDAITTLKNEVGEENLLMLVGVFSQELTEYGEILDNSPSLLQIQEICHALKSSAKSFGALQLAALVIECEAQAKEQHTQWVNDHLLNLRSSILELANQYQDLSQNKQLLNRFFE